jgi:hypothetical protein
MAQQHKLVALSVCLHQMQGLCLSSHNTPQRKHKQITHTQMCIGMSLQYVRVITTF